VTNYTNEMTFPGWCNNQDVEFSGSPVEITLFLGNVIPQPVVVHVERFGFFHANLGVEDIVSGGIVGFKRSTGDMR
jgi:hypothetical protein